MIFDYTKCIPIIRVLTALLCYFSTTVYNQYCYWYCSTFQTSILITIFQYRQKHCLQYPKQQFKMEKAETKNVFKDFCESTSLHGYSYLFIGNSIFLKIIWTIVILLMTCVGAMFLMNNTVDYWNARLITTLESSSAPLKVKIWKQTLNLTNNLFTTSEPPKYLNWNSPNLLLWFFYDSAMCNLRRIRKED